MNIKITSSIAAILLTFGLLNTISAAEVIVVELKKVSVDDVYNMVKTLAESDRKVLIEKNLKMNKEQSQKFWPVYTAYRKDINAVQQQQFDLIKKFAKNYQNLTDDKAAKLLDTHLQSKRNLLNIRKKYLSDFRDSVPAKKIAKFFQVENKLNAIVNVQLAQDIPIVK
ncbi:MAG: hypothetical protein ACC653_12530 [Gammaproteobacteria bacterium]